MIETASSDFFEMLSHKALSEGHFPLSGSLELTLRCNLECLHCYARCPTLYEHELSTDDVCRILDKLKDCGVLMLTLTGGEPLLRPDFAHIYTHAKKCGFLLTVMTNATLIDNSIAELLARLPPRRVEATIYGSTPEIYESITGIPGSFARFENGLTLLRQFNVPVNLKMMVLRQNFASFPDIKHYAEARNLPFRYDSIVNPRLDGNSEPLHNRIPPEQTAALHRMAIESHPPSSPPAPSEKTNKPERLFRCGAGSKTFHIDSQGKMHPCLMWRWNPFDLLSRDPLKEWESHLRFIKTDTRPSSSLCMKCRNLSACVNCPAFSKLEKGVAGGDVEYFCHIMDERSLSPCC